MMTAIRANRGSGAVAAIEGPMASKIFQRQATRRKVSAAEMRRVHRVHTGASDTFLVRPRRGSQMTTRMGLRHFFERFGFDKGVESTESRPVLSSSVSGRAPSRNMGSRAEHADGTFSVGGVNFALMEDPDNLSLGALQNTGAYVWPPARVLSDYMVDRADVIRGARVLELGAGQGLCGLVASSLGARAVCLTERLEPVTTAFPSCDPDAMSDAYQDAMWEELMEEYRASANDLQSAPTESDEDNAWQTRRNPGSDRLLQSLQKNIDRNMNAIMERRGSDSLQPVMSVEELSFGDTAAARRVLQRQGPFDLVLGSDITYMSQVRPALMQTLQQIRSASPTPVTVWISHMKGIPGSLQDVLAGLQGAGYRTEIVHEREGVVVLECTSQEGRAISMSDITEKSV